MGKKIAKVLAFCIPVVVIAATIVSLNRGGSRPEDTWGADPSSQEEITKSENPSQEETTPSQTESSAVRTDIEDGFILISGGTFEMGSLGVEVF